MNRPALNHEFAFVTGTAGRVMAINVCFQNGASVRHLYYVVGLTLDHRPNLLVDQVKPAVFKFRFDHVYSFEVTLN